MLNNVVLIGRLVRDPELTHTGENGGFALCKFTLAIDRPFTDRTTGEREADFIDVSTWRKLAELCAKYLTKGGQAAVVGRIKTRTYDDRDGVRRKAWEIEADDVRFLQRAPGTSGGIHAGAGDDMAAADRDIPF